MTKSLKGLSSRNFTTTTNLEEAIVGRQAILALQATDLTPAEGEGLYDPGTLYDKLGQMNGVSDVIVLPCLDDKQLMLRMLEQGGRSLTADSPLAAFPGSIADEINPSMAVGGSFSGVIDVDGDVDDITVFLVAGQIYLISMRGTGANPLNDSFLRVFNPAANGGAQLAVDDDGGNDLNSFVTFAATFTGQHVIRATSFNNNPDALNLDTGSYTVDVRVRGVDAVGDTNATSVPLSLGTTFGHRETGVGANNNPQNLAGNAFGYPAGTFNGDTDRYSVTLEAGHFYQFKVAGGWDSNPGAENDTAIALYNAAGNVLAVNDDVNGGAGDFSSALGFYAATSGTYYLDVFAYANQNAGYIIDFQDIDYASMDPLDSIDWMNADVIDTVPGVDNLPTAYVYFALAGESFGELNDAGTGPRESFGWNAYEKQQLLLALAEFTKITGIQYAETSDVNQAEFRVMTTTSEDFGAFFYPQDPAFGTQQGIGAFNVDSGGWNKPGASDPALPIGQESLERGGFSFAVILHEFGHAHGLAHPHDNGGGSAVMLGVGGPDSLGLFDLNQGVYTVMSYNDAWELHPDGPSPFTLAGIDNGWSATLSAFDIAQMQIRYGVHDYNDTDTVYMLTDVVEDAFYECIWDSGGLDEIAYAGALNATIDLTAATIDYSPTGGGVLSFLDAGPGAQTLRGGYTIARNVVIENATGGTGDDTLIGNSAANVITANDGADDLVGRGGDDTLHGGAGSDTAYYDGNRADYTIEAIITNGAVTGFTITDDNTAAPANSGNPIRVADEGTDTLDGVETLDFADVTVNLVGSVIVYDEFGEVVSIHVTIQAAIDDATTLNGYTIFAGAGTYPEDVNVTKDLTILGANNGLTGTDPGRLDETSIRSITISVDGVTVDGVEVTGSLNSAGVYVNAGSDNFELLNSVLNGTSDAYGVLTGQVADLNVHDNVLSGYGIGMYVSGGDTTGTIGDNLFQGGGEDVTAGGGDDGLYNGIILETSHVTVDSNVFDSMYYSSIVITPFGPNTVDLATIITNNTFPGTLAERVIFIYPTDDTPNVLGTDHNEGFDAETAQTPTGQGGYGYTPASTSFDGRGGNDYAWGGELADDYSGGAGSDQLFGKGGDDTLNGGADNDLLDGDAGIDTAVFAASSLTYVDTVAGWLVQSSEGNDFLEEVEIVEADGQRNLLVGGTGFATLQAALDAAEDGDNVRLATGTYSGTFSYDDEDLTIIAQPNAQINATFTPTGTQGIAVYGSVAADTITTGAGNDLLVGGGGNDTTAGGGGDDSYIVEQAGDIVLEGSGEGYDTVYALTSYELGFGQEVEVLTVYDRDTANAINLTGNNLANVIYGNQGSNLLNGGAGDDTLYGLGGNDAYIVEDSGDVVIEGAGGGFDTVYTFVSHQLLTDQEVETLTVYDRDTTNALDLTGNNLANTIYGNAGTNVIDGKGGNDALYGMAGADTFQFTAAPGAGNVDALADFSAADDTIALDDVAFLGIGSPGALDPNAFVIGSAAQDADDRIVYDQATGQLYFDADGNGSGAAVLFATLNPGTILTASDFTVI